MKRKQNRKSHSKAYAKSRELMKVVDRQLSKKVKQLSHRFQRKLEKAEVRKWMEEGLDND